MKDMDIILPYSCYHMQSTQKKQGPFPCFSVERQPFFHVGNSIAMQEIFVRFSIRAVAPMGTRSTYWQRAIRSLHVPPFPEGSTLAE